MGLGFALLDDGRLADLSPAAAGKPVLVFDGSAWAPFKGLVGDLMDAKPVTAERAREIVSGGTAPQASAKIA